LQRQLERATCALLVLLALLVCIVCTAYVQQSKKPFCCKHMQQKDFFIQPHFDFALCQPSLCRMY